MHWHGMWGGGNLVDNATPHLFFRVVREYRQFPLQTEMVCGVNLVDRRFPALSVAVLSEVVIHIILYSVRRSTAADF